jgi:hypothetical protein
MLSLLTEAPARADEFIDGLDEALREKKISG